MFCTTYRPYGTFKISFLFFYQSIAPTELNFNTLYLYSQLTSLPSFSFPPPPAGGEIEGARAFNPPKAYSPHSSHLAIAHSLSVLISISMGQLLHILFFLFSRCTQYVPSHLLTVLLKDKNIG